MEKAFRKTSLHDVVTRVAALAAKRANTTVQWFSDICAKRV